MRGGARVQDGRGKQKGKDGKQKGKGRAGCGTLEGLG